MISEINVRRFITSVLIPILVFSGSGCITTSIVAVDLSEKPPPKNIIVETLAGERFDFYHWEVRADTLTGWIKHSQDRTIPVDSIAHIYKTQTHVDPPNSDTIKFFIIVGCAVLIFSLFHDILGNLGKSIEHAFTGK